MKNKLLLIAMGIAMSAQTLMAQVPTQQWLTVLNSASPTVDQIYGFSTPQGGCTDNANSFYNAPSHIKLNTSSNQVGFSFTSGCNPFSGAVDSNTGVVLSQNSISLTQQGIAVEFDANANLFSLSAGSSSSLRKTSAAGSVNFTNTINNGTQYNQHNFGVLKIGTDDKVYCYGGLRALPNGNFSMAVNTYNTSGTLLWTSIINDLDWFYGYPGRMTTDNNNNVIFSGKRQTTQGDQNTYDIVLRKVNSSGIQQWQVYYNWNNLADYVDSIVTDNNGDVYMISINTNAWSTRTRRLVKLSGVNGAIIFQQQISNTISSGEIKISSNGNILVADDNVIKSFNQANGTLLWTSPTLTNYQTFTTDVSGNVYVTLKDKVQIFNSSGTLINTITPTIPSYTVNLRMSQVDSSGNSLYIIGERSNSSSNKVFITKYNVQSYSDTCNNVSGSLTQGLVGYWPFCGNANDDSGSGYNGTVNGATLTTDRFGNANSAYQYNGVNSKIDMTTSDFGAGTFSISGWFKTSENIPLGSYRQIWMGGYNILQYKEVIEISVASGPGSNSSLGSNKLWAYVRDAQGISAGLNSSVPVNNGNWNQFILTRENSSLKLYLNGVLIGSTTCSTSDLTYDGSCTIGNGTYNTTNRWFNGQIDDIGIWNRALTQEEITNLFNANQCITNITVTDTLIINVGQLSYTSPIAYSNSITIAPNPASTQININFNNITDLNGGTIKIINSLGQQVATTPITTSGTQSVMQLATWGGTGMYFVQIINPQGQIVDIKKIILQ